MARLPTPRKATVLGHVWWATTGDFYFSARLDRQLPERAVVCASAGHYPPWDEYRAHFHVMPSVFSLLLFKRSADVFRGSRATLLTHT
jgi:hypothetical protein